MRIAVLLLNYGCPDSPRAVYPFLYNLFNDPAILPVPAVLRSWLAARIATRRWPEAADNYRRIGGSPMRRIIEQQCRALQKALEDLGEVRVDAGMRYWHPFIHETMAAIKAWNPDRLIALPLFPHYCAATTGTVFGAVHRHAGPLRRRLAYVDAYFDHPDYLAAMIDTIRHALAGAQASADTVLLFSAHGVPQKMVDRGDPYVHHIRQCAERIAEALPYESRLSFQSRVGKARWYGDFTLDTVAALGQSGVRSLAVVPLSFTSENVETLYELDMLVKQAAVASGVVHYIRVPTLDTSPRYIKALAELVRMKCRQSCSRGDAFTIQRQREREGYDDA
jgi:ferrochelatase